MAKKIAKTTRKTGRKKARKSSRVVKKTSKAKYKIRGKKGEYGYASEKGYYTPHKPQRPRVQVGLVDWPIGEPSHRVHVAQQGTPEIGHESIGVIDRLDSSRPIGPQE